MNKIKKGLTIIGLTNLEAEVYLELLKLKKAKVSELIKITKVTRTQLYPLLEKLVKKGVLRKTSGRPAYYEVFEPDEIINLIEKWKNDQLAILKELELRLKKK
jgi:sugar-specific transcriptional regulator TrmB